MRLPVALIGGVLAACSRTDSPVRPSASAPQKIMQLVGDLDRETTPPSPVRSRSVSAVGLVGTDLGFSFLHKGKLYFLFGDTIPVEESAQRPKDCDAIAWSDDFASSTDGDRGFDLHFLTEPDAVDPTKTTFQPVRLDGRALGTVELPTTGFSEGGTMYVFFVVGGRSILATSHDDGKSFQTLLRVPASKLVNVMPVVVPSADVPGGKTVLMWGRHASDAIYLAEAPLDAIADASAWRFYAGKDGAGQPVWNASEASASAVVQASSGCNGNFSITYVAGLDRWLMLNRCDEPHAILLRSAASPLGTWSEARVFFDREADGGYCRFIHRGCDPARGDCCDANFQPTHDGQWGAGQDGYPYAPFVIAPYTRWDANARVATLYFLMSVWNPYSPMLMRATVSAADVP